ncbi:type II secretion system F family protein [Bowmanella yangjiangensis]|uniref:Type II secretion system F family protein n=1 Tax=Bowmanella yangjiangensis TaxID=2811230 RepID=A0ABS3CVJ5_9ALTE|nr:type II secretion system F family protein [Bowmanella yangjiangensis]MBN7820436.1 type II secretion system F family protein [Bowmanella yangjiangensis]
MKFRYQGIEIATEQRVEGEIDAVSYAEAIRQLADRRIEAFALEEYTKPTKHGRKVKVSDLVLPLQELATLTRSGVALIDAVKALAQNEEHPNLARGFAAIASRIEGGDTLSSAILESGLPFPEYVAHLVSAGEAGGQLAGALSDASAQMNYEQSVKSDIQSALTYPLVLIGSGLVAMLIIFFAVVPKFSHMLDGDKELPTLAFLVLSAGRSANESPLLLFGFVGALVLLIVLVLGNPKVRRALMDRIIDLPVIGPWLAEQDAARWASLCAAMLLARVNLLTALKLSAASCAYTKRRKRALAMIQDVQDGVAFTEALSRSRLVPGTSLNLVAVGDKTGQLAEMLKAVAALHDTSCKRRMKQVLTLMEPIAILIVGVLIGVMILGIVLAITASTDIAI